MTELDRTKPNRHETQEGEGGKVKEIRMHIVEKYDLSLHISKPTT